MSGEILPNAGSCETPRVFDMADMMENNKKQLEEEGVDLSYNDEPSSSDTDSRDLDCFVSDGWINLWGDEELKKRIVEPGEPNTKPDQGYLCTLNIVGCLKDGTIFDDFEPLNIQVGDAEVVLGIDLVLISMDVGEKALVEVSPKLGYGSLGRYPDVPPNEVLIYLVQLESAEPELYLGKYTTSELKTIGSRKRLRGDWWHARDELAIALSCYRRALDFLGYDSRPLGDTSFAAEDELMKDRLKVYDNIAAIYLKTAEYDLALKAIDHVLASQPENVEALHRKGKILVALERHTSALEILSLAIELEPENNDLRNEVNAILPIMKKPDSLEAMKLHGKMFGNMDEDAVSVAEIKTVNTYTVDTKTVNTQVVNTETVDTDTVNTEIDNTENVNTKAANTENVNTETVDTKTVNIKNVKTETDNTVNVITVAINKETLHTEIVNTKTVNTENLKTVAVNKKTLNTKIINTDTVTTQNVQSPPTTKAKTKSALNLKRNKSANRKSKMALIAVCTVTAVAAGLVAYRYRNNFL